MTSNQSDLGNLQDDVQSPTGSNRKSASQPALSRSPSTIPPRYSAQATNKTEDLSPFSEALSPSEGNETGSDSETSIWAEHPHASLDWDPSGAVLIPLKLLYIKQLLDSFNHSTSETANQEGSDRPTTSNNGKRQASSPYAGSKPGARTLKKAKTQSNDVDDGDAEENDDDKDEAGSESLNITGNGKVSKKVLACPFVKRYPDRYYKCYSHELKSVSRVKQHLTRCHCLPIYCPNCSKTFSQETVRDQHIRVGKCVRKPPKEWDGVTVEQKKVLGKRSSSKGSVRENWDAIYKILFPSEPLPESPYLDPLLSAELRAFQNYIRVQGPAVWDAILATHLPPNLRPHLEELQSFQRSFHSEAMDELFERYGSGPFITTSPPSQLSLDRIPQETEAVVKTLSATTTTKSQSPAESGSTADRGVANDSQTESETIPAGPNTTSAPYTELQKQPQQQELLEVQEPSEPQRSWTSQEALFEPFSDSFNPSQGPLPDLRRQNTDLLSDAVLDPGASGAFEYDGALPQITLEPAGSLMTTINLEQLPTGVLHESDVLGSYDQTNFEISLSPSGAIFDLIDFPAWAAWEQQH